MNLMRRTLHTLVGSLIALTLTGTALAQTKTAEAKPCDAASYPTASARHDCFEANRVVKTYFLAHTYQQADANEVLIALRNVLDQEIKIYFVASENAIVLSAPPDQQAIAKRIIEELDHPKKLYRLTFTLAESDSGKRVGVQHFAMIVADGQRTTLKQGDKIPVATGTYDAKNDTGSQTQFQYLDIGINFDATLTDSPGGIQLKSKIEESSLGQPSLIAGVQEPVIRQTVLEGTSILTSGKPVALGSLDLEGTTRHIDIEVVAEPVS